MRLEVVSEEVGVAAATKMFRSIIVKGLEALMLECVLAAAPYGADERVFASLGESFPGIDWQRLANYMVSRVVVHGERRAREMEEVAETLESLGIEPIMAEAAARRQDWCAQLGISKNFGPEGPKTYREVLTSERDRRYDRNAACRDAIRCRRRHHIPCKGSRANPGTGAAEGLDLSNDARQPRRDRIGLL